MVHRRWGSTLGKLFDAEDYLQQSWLYFLEGVPPAPEGVNEAVWQVGRLAGKLHAWCRSAYRRVSREAQFPEGFDDDLGSALESAERWLDAVSLAEERCTPDELACVYFRFAGYRGPQAQEILGINEAAYRQRLHRLRERLTSE
jgi:DNA-directed RNA polymerase specialized sigma24 family protein